MPLLFRDGDGIRAKSYTLFILLITLFSVYGLWIDFTPSDFSKDKIGIYSWIIGIILFIPIYLDKHPKNTLKEKPLLLFSLYPILVGLSYAVIIFSIPAVIIKNNGDDFHTTGKIYKKYSTKVSRTCNNPIYVKDIYNENYSYKLCSNSNFVNSIKINEHLALEGKESKYGRIINSFSLQPEL